MDGFEQGVVIAVLISLSLTALAWILARKEPWQKPLDMSRVILGLISFSAVSFAVVAVLGINQLVLETFVSNFAGVNFVFCLIVAITCCTQIRDKVFRVTVAPSTWLAFVWLILMMLH